MTDYSEDTTNAELRKLAEERGLEPASNLNKAQLLELLSEYDNREAAVAELEGTDAEAAAEMTDEQKDLANLDLAAHGPVGLESPSERVMTGAVTEEQAEEQLEATEDLEPEEKVGDLTETGEPLSTPVDEEELADAQEEAAQNDGTQSLADREAELGESHSGLFPNGQPVWNQTAQLYTDGLGGGGGHRLDDAYNTEPVRRGVDLNADTDFSEE